MYDFNDDVPAVDGVGRHDPLTASPAAAADAVPTPPTETTATPTTAAVAQSPAFVRFRTCRWQQPIEKGGAEFCTHREVKPYAGTSAFDADAWCGDCQYYKLRRVPKKRPRDEDDWAY